MNDTKTGWDLTASGQNGHETGADLGEVSAEILRLSELLHRGDTERFQQMVRALLEQMDTRARHELLQTFRAPRYAPGLLKEHPAWPDVVDAITAVREAERQEAAS
jgi:hypothetical protein